MSLESQIASLVSASNDLTEVVAGQVDAIDAAVTSLQNDVGQFLTNLTDSYAITVDAVSGNDAAADLDGATVTTVAEALRRVKPYHVNIILLSNNQTHYFSQDVMTAANAAMTGIEQGHIHFHASSVDDIQQPNATSPLLVWNATLTTTMDITFGGSAAPLKIRHIGGALVSENPWAGWGTGRPAFNQVNIAHSVLDLNAANSAFLQRNGQVYLRMSTVNQNATGALLADEVIEFVESTSSLGGSEGPKQWSQVMGDTKPMSNAALTARFAQTGVCNIYLDTTTGDDKNDGLSAATPIRTASRLADILMSSPAMFQNVYISGTADFVVDTPINFIGHRANLSFQALTGRVIFPASAIYDGQTYVGDGVHPITFFGPSNLITCVYTTGGHRAEINLPAKSGYTGSGNEDLYKRRQGAFRIGSIWSSAPAHLGIVGADIAVGNHQTLVTRNQGHLDYSESAESLVVKFTDCSSVVGATASNLLYGVVEATGTITDTWT